MASSVTSTTNSCHLGSSFLGERSALRVTGAPVTRFGFLRRTVECKESRIRKRPIEVPSNVTITMEGQDLRVKGSLGELSRTYPREVKIEKEASGILRVYKAMKTRRANQMHGLFRCVSLFRCLFRGVCGASCWTRVLAR